MRRGLAVTLGLFASLGSPARARAQSPGDAGASGWNLPSESAPPPAPAEGPSPTQGQEPAPTPPPAVATASPPPAQIAAPRAEPPPLERRFPVTVSLEVGFAEIRGPGIEKPLVCSGTCTFRLQEGVHWLDIRASGRTWTMTVNVNRPERVVIETPSAGARGIGIAAIIVGGIVLSIAGSFVYVVAVNCGNGGPYEGSAQCRSDEEAVPYWLAAAGVGAVVSVVGIMVFVSNNKPSIELLPALGPRARRPGTFVGLGPVDGSTLPGLSLRTSF